jgi:hypothetical protein
MVGDGLIVSFSDETNVHLTYRVIDGQLTADGDLNDKQRRALISLVDNDVDPLLPLIDARLRIGTGPGGSGGNGGGNGGNGSLVSTAYKSYNMVTGNPDTYYMAGYYSFPATSITLTQASASITFGTADTSYAAHASVVMGGAGSVDTGQVGLRVTGTSINDDGVRTPVDLEVLTNDITTLSLDQYLETNKKWLGVTTFELFTVSGSPTTFSVSMNYGFTKYEDFGNVDFTVTNFECVGRSASADANFDIILYKHDTSSWTYSAASFDPGGTIIVQMTTDHGSDNHTTNNDLFAYKRSNLNTDINGADSEGVIIAVITSAGNTVEIMDCHIGVVDQ